MSELVKEPTTDDVEAALADLKGLGDAVQALGHGLYEQDKIKGNGLVVLGALIRSRSDEALEAAWPLMVGRP